MSDAPPIEEQIGHALVRPVARLAKACGISLRDTGAWMQVAYFHELQSQGMKMREIAEHLGISMRKVALLSSQFKRTFFDLYQNAELPRRVEFLLWARPLSRARILQTLPEVSEAEVDQALTKLLSENRIATVERASSVIYKRVHSDARLVSDRLIDRLDGLHNLLGSVYNVVFRRFMRDDERAFARTVSARIRSADLGELKKLYEEVIWQRIIELEKSAADSTDDTLAIELSLLFGPSPDDQAGQS